MILDGNGVNNAMPESSRWAQNAPIKVDGTTIRYCPSYYQVKHFSSNINGGARRIKVEGNNLGEGSVKNHVQDVRAIGFQNTDGEIVLNVKNSTDETKAVTVVVNGKAFDMTLPAHSINTFKLNGIYENTHDATGLSDTDDITSLKFTNVETQYLLVAEGYGDGDAIKTTSNSGSDDQKWAVEFVRYEGEGTDKKAYYKIISYKSNLVLTALGADKGYALTQRQFKDTPDQLWTLNVVGGEWSGPKQTPVETEDGAKGRKKHPKKF